jgi:hypothetical protein
MKRSLDSSLLNPVEDAGTGLNRQKVVYFCSTLLLKRLKEVR